MTQAQDQLKTLASRHLGKAGDGSLVKPYTTPDKHDKDLLVPLPRVLNREKSNIETSDFYGYEIWHAYEMSFLLRTGMPYTGVLRVRFGHDTENMIESKSFKLYLNSFDLEKFDNVEEVESILAEDLSKAANGKVSVKLHEASDCEFKKLPFTPVFVNVDKQNITIEKYTEDSDLLDTMNSTTGELAFHTSNLRSNCEITNQKDTGNSFIYMKGNLLPSIEGLTRYIISFRDTQHFHENATEIIYQTLQKKYAPEELAVLNIYNRRGGLDIHSFRGTSQEVLERIAGDYDDVTCIFAKTSQQ
jgi:7-cyano-7-deazaguanine reductase